MDFAPAYIPEVVLVKPKVFGDARGFFLEAWREDKFASAGLPLHFVQDNRSRSSRWTLRGLHYQVIKPQGKLVQVVRGSVFDVAVDVRSGSPTYGQWVGVELSDTNHYMLWVPPGFAHGFLALSDSVDLIYKCTDFYAPQYERVIRWDDPTIAIDWPLPSGIMPLLSARDGSARGLDAAEVLR